MVLPIVKYGDPVLRKKGVRVESITPEIRRLIEDMLETMKASHGVGLAAQQVGRAVQVAVIDVTGVTDRPSTLDWNGAPADPLGIMPLVLINPAVKPLTDPVAGPEGCLSFPEIFAEISRPESVEVSAWDRAGKTFSFRCGGLLARAIQHELDHLHGILFIDRMSARDKTQLRPELEVLQAETKSGLIKRT